jgi:hypothetical protein
LLKYNGIRHNGGVSSELKEPISTGLCAEQAVANKDSARTQRRHFTNLILYISKS